VNFIAVRMAEAYTHPRVLSETGGSMPGEMRLTFLVALAAMAMLFVTLWKIELTSKNASDQLRKLRRRLEATADDDEGPEPPKAHPEPVGAVR
jgi:heme exporter protein C